MYCEGCEEPVEEIDQHIICPDCMDKLADHYKLDKAIKGMRLAIDTKYNKNIKRVLENTLVKIGEKL